MEHFMSSVAKCVEILGCFSTDRTELSVSGVARKLDMPKSSVSRMLSEMAGLGLVQRDPRTRRYIPGYLLFQLGAIYHLRFDMLDIVERVVRDLVKETGLFGYIGILVGSKAVALHLFPGESAIRFVLDVGRRSPARTLSFGKALLARRTDAEIRAMMERAPGDAPEDMDAFLADMAEIRERGWAVQNATSFPDVRGIGVALVSELSGQAVGYSLSYPMADLDQDQVDDVIRRLVNSARQVAGIVRDSYWLTK
jgi:DNA-binding IclR family transcriptional regulator